jgi:uncharacterized protein (DUF1501 family)
MKRRNFIQAVGAAPLACGPLRLWAVPGTVAKTRFVLVLLRGGYDAASLLIPYQSSFYYEARPNIAIARPGSGADTAKVLDATWALHPALAQSIYPLYQAKQVVFIPFAGSQDKSRSHFHAQDILELGQGYGARLEYGSGFLNRTVEVLGRAGRGGVSFTDNLPLVFKGNANVANLGVKRGGKHALNQRQSDLLEKMYEGTSLGQNVHDGLETRRQMGDELQQEMIDSARGAANAKNFEQEARRMARLMADNANYSVGFVDVGGWDTHVHQGAAKGALSDRLRSLGEGLAGFAQEMGPAWRDTVVVVVSEFGRTFRENGDKGTDHGHGSVIWVLGGGIAGGRVAGEQIGVSYDSLFQNRDFNVLNEYRSLLGYVFARQYGFGNTEIEYIFPGAAPARYAFL